MLSILFPIVISLVVGEILVRQINPQSLILLRPDIWIPAAQLGWKHSPNVDTYVNTGEREVHWKTDNEGFRVGSNQSNAEDMRIVAIGDSFLAAMQVEYEDTMTARLEKHISSRSNKKMQILNTGVGGWNPNQYRMQVKKILEKFSVDGIIVFVYLGNDIIGGRTEDYPPKQPVERHLLRIPYSFQWKELVTSTFYPINDFLEVRSHFYIYVKNKFKYFLMSLGLAAQRFPHVLLTKQASSHVWKTTADVLEEISLMGDRFSLRPLFVLIPSLYEVNPKVTQMSAKAFNIPLDAIDLDQTRRHLSVELKKRNLFFVDTTPVLRAAIKEQADDVYGRIDSHLGRGGHRIIANTIEAYVWQMLCLRISSSSNDCEAY